MGLSELFPFILCGVFFVNGAENPMKGKCLSLVPGVCTEGLFQCEDDTMCVPQARICNGVEDCLNGSDEKCCDDDAIDNFYDNHFRKRPSAENDHIQKVCNFSYSGSCVCRGKELLCGYKNFEQIPGDLPQDETISLLDFEGNHFHVLSHEFLQKIPQGVEKLNLAHCGVNSIKSGSFLRLNEIRDLHLHNNDLKTFPAGVFAADNNLQSLFLNYNSLSKIEQDAFVNLTDLKTLDLSGNKFTEIEFGGGILEPLKGLAVLHLQNNRIRHVAKGSFPSTLTNLSILSLVENRIETLDKGAFAQLENLQHLYLAGNRLVSLKNGTFRNLGRLTFLTLDKNFIESIETGVFSDTPQLESLSLSKNQIRFLPKQVMEPLKGLLHLYFDRFELCESAPLVTDCEPKGDGISSYGDLLANPILRTCVWVMGVVGCAGNLIVLFGRFLAPTNNVVHSLYLRNLAFSDLLMGVYLFSIAAADIRYRGEYLSHQYKWRHHYVCKLCGFLSTLSCESSVLILSLVTWDRFVSVTQPLARKQPSPKAAALTLGFLWSLAAGVSFAPLTEGYFGDEFYGNNGVCLALHIHDPYAEGWEYSAAMFMFVNALALAFICYAYIRMINEIRASGVACRSTRQSQDRDKVAQRFGIIVLTDCLCWLPIIGVKLIALTGCSIPQDLYAWLAIFILPINSALNPILYTLTTTIFKKQMRKILNSCISKKRQADAHSASESGFSLSFGVFPIGGSTRRILSHRATQSSSLNSNTKNSWKRPPTAV